MAKQIINVGAVANDGTGDALRFAFTKTNENFAELYNKDGDLTASIAAVANSIPTDVSQLTDTAERIPDRDYNRLFNKPIADIVSVPLTSKGQIGQLATSIAYDSNYFYFCVANYTGGAEDIWKRVAWSNDTW
jgi:hypothetical protein